MELLAMAINLTKTNGINLTKDNVKISATDELLNIVGDIYHRLNDNVIEDKGQAVLLMSVFNGGTHVNNVMAISYDRYANDITSVEFFKLDDLKKIENYVMERIVDKKCIKKIYDICQSFEYDYYFIDGEVYLKDDFKVHFNNMILSLRHLMLYEVRELVRKLEEHGMQGEILKIQNKSYLSFCKEDVDNLNFTTQNFYSLLAECGIIFYRTENKKRYFSYRDRRNKKDIKRFAIDIEALDKIMQGRLLSA